MLLYYVCLFMIIFGNILRAGEAEKSIIELEAALRQIAAVKIISQNALTEDDKTTIHVRAEMTSNNLEKAENRYYDFPAVLSGEDRKRAWKKSELESWGIPTNLIGAILSPDEALIKKYGEDDQAYLQTARKFLNEVIPG